MTHKALDAGINFIDTADRYSLGTSEEIVGRAIKGRRDNVVVATKFYGPMGDDINMQGGSRRWVTQAVEDSLRRLDTDYIDLYQMHRPDPRTDFGDTLAALTDLVRAGKIRMIGTSTFPAELIVEGQWAAERRGLERVRCEQPPYSIFTREIERSVLPTCAAYDMGVIVWSPLNGGWLTGKYRKDTDWPENSRATPQHRQRQALGPGKPGGGPQAQLGRRTRLPGRRGGVLDGHPGLRLHPGPPRGDLHHHRPPHPPTTRRRPRRPRPPPYRRRLGPHRRAGTPGTDLNPDDAFYIPPPSQTPLYGGSRKNALQSARWPAHLYPSKKRSPADRCAPLRATPQRSPIRPPGSRPGR